MNQAYDNRSDTSVDRYLFGNEFVSFQQAYRSILSYATDINSFKLTFGTNGYEYNITNDKYVACDSLTLDYIVIENIDNNDELPIFEFNLTINKNLILRIPSNIMSHEKYINKWIFYIEQSKYLNNVFNDGFLLSNIKLPFNINLQIATKQHYNIVTLYTTFTFYTISDEIIKMPEYSKEVCLHTNVYLTEQSDKEIFLNKNGCISGFYVSVDDIINIKNIQLAFYEPFLNNSDRIMYKKHIRLHYDPIMIRLYCDKINNQTVFIHMTIDNFNPKFWPFGFYNSNLVISSITVTTTNSQPIHINIKNINIFNYTNVNNFINETEKNKEYNQLYNKGIFISKGDSIYDLVFSE